MTWNDLHGNLENAIKKGFFSLFQINNLNHWALANAWAHYRCCYPRWKPDFLQNWNIQEYEAHAIMYLQRRCMSMNSNKRRIFTEIWTLRERINSDICRRFIIQCLFIHLLDLQMFCPAKSFLWGNFHSYTQHVFHIHSDISYRLGPVCVWNQ